MIFYIKKFRRSVFPMNKTPKIISVILAVVMALSVFPFAAFAAEDDADRVDSWKANYALLLEEVFDNAKFTSWNYVDQNRKAIDASDAALTAFALYDSAWINYFKNGSTADPENAKKALLALTEKASYEFNDGYVDEIAKIIDTAEDVNDMIQKVGPRPSSISATSARRSTLIRMPEISSSRHTPRSFPCRWRICIMWICCSTSLIRIPTLL